MQTSIKKIFSFLLLGMIIFTSCSKELDQKPVSTADKNAVFSSEDGLKLYTNSFYNILPDINTVYKTDCTLSDFGAVTTLPDYIRPGAYTSRQGTGWVWTDLRNINYFIENCNNPAVAQPVRENYIGIARFFRAYFYFEKVKRFGDVPWYNKPLDVADADLYKARDPRTLIMDSVVADLDYAATHIINEDATRSLITKWVAYGLKSRACLFEGTFRKYQASYGLGATADVFLQAAATAAKAVIAGTKFSLNTSAGNLSYRNLFISTAPVINEVMLANITSAALAKTNDANWYFTSATYGPRFNFTRTFINTYLNIDGTRFTDVEGHDTIPFINETKNRDLRLQQTIRVGSYKRTSNGSTLAAPPVFSYSYTGYQPIKWCLDDMSFDAGALNTNTVCQMRYAEILLNYAEAQAELGVITNADWATTIGALRARAGITTGLTALPTVADPYMQANYFPDITNAALLEIRRERGIELALEGFRFNDLARWKHGELLLKQWDGMYVPALNIPMDLNNDGTADAYFYKGTAPTPPVAGISYVNVTADPQKLSQGTYGELHWLDNIARDWQDYKYLYPIPFADLQINPNLIQNKGW